ARGPVALGRDINLSPNDQSAQWHDDHGRRNVVSKRGPRHESEPHAGSDSLLYRLATSEHGGGSQSGETHLRERSLHGRARPRALFAHHESVMPQLVWRDGLAMRQRMAEWCDQYELVRREWHELESIGVPDAAHQCYVILPMGQ